MLNELVIVERGAQQAGIAMIQRHPDVKGARQMPTALVSLESDGRVASLQLVPPSVTPWTLRDGQHNSFPFVQPKQPLWVLADEADGRRRAALDKKNHGRREALFGLASAARLNTDGFAEWPGLGLLNRLRERRHELAALQHTDATVVLDTIDRFLLACDPNKDGASQHLLQAIVEQSLSNLRQAAQQEWVELAAALLLGKKKDNRWECSGALLFDATGSQKSITDAAVAAQVSEALRRSSKADGDERGTLGVCHLTGDSTQLISGNFPQPNLPVLGQTYLFSKNRDVPANDRYGRFSADGMAVGCDTAIRLAAAFEALTTDDRRGVTWRPIPGEVPKQSDLLLAFVEQAPDAPAAAAFSDDGPDEDFAEEATGAPHADGLDSIAAFEKRAERIMDAVRAQVGAEFQKAPVRLAVFRKVDPANRKVVYAGAPTVGDLYNAATDWADGERNVPGWLSLPILLKAERSPRRMSPPHVAPLGAIRFSKQTFLRNGMRPDGKNKEQVGLTASEALGLFLDRITRRGDPAWRRVERVLRLVLTRRAALIAATAHSMRRGLNDAKKFDRLEALRTITLLCVLLHKFRRRKEGYMAGAAFKLGQLLAVADAVHAGYCADVRGGDLPPSLLGNQVFTMAQSAPAKALATLCRRWKPYDGWAKKNSNFTMPERFRADGGRWKKRSQLDGSKEKTEFDRAASISIAVSQARRVGPIAEELQATLRTISCDDVFRAELLLGYMSGLPRSQGE